MISQTDRGIFNLGDIRNTGYISCFHLERDTTYLPDDKKSRKLKNTLLEIEQKHNHSWYRELCKRAQAFNDKPALFYRGNKISFNEMILSADKLAAAMSAAGVAQGCEIAVCMTNVPELVYIMLALNKLGAKMNSFSAGYNPAYIQEILAGCNQSIIFLTDDAFEIIHELVNESNFDNIVLISKTRSLPVRPEDCSEYVPALSALYQMTDFSDKYLDGKRIISFDEFVDRASLQTVIVDEGTLDTEFLVTYTSGSTKIGYPKAIIHTNRSLIVSGRFHDAEVSGNPDLKGLRALAMIHPDSNTCLITCISDILMQGWCVALEPEHNVNAALDYLFINSPNYANMTSVFWNEAARQYLTEKRFSGKKLGFLLAAFAVGENIGNGEEYFINKFLKKAKAGSSVSIKGLHLPYAPVSIGGGDCEHGGIYYTLWKALYSKLYYFKLHGKPIGMLPEKYVIATVLKEKNGQWAQCGSNELGLVVANSATTMKGYKNDPIETADKVITDENGRDWVSCNVLGFIDEAGAVHVKGRIEEFRGIGNKKVYPFMIDEVINRDKRNILSSTTVFKKDGSLEANIVLSPLSKETEAVVIERAKGRCQKCLSKEVNAVLKFRVFRNITDLPITGSGKRNIRALEDME